MFFRVVLFTQAQINVSDQNFCGPDTVSFSSIDVGCSSYDWYNENYDLIGSGCSVTTSFIAFDQKITIVNNTTKASIVVGPNETDPTLTGRNTFPGANLQGLFTINFEVKVPMVLSSVSIVNIRNNDASRTQEIYADLIAPGGVIMQTVTIPTTLGVGEEKLSIVFNEPMPIGKDYRIKIRDNGNKAGFENYVMFQGGDYSTRGGYDYDFMRIMGDRREGWYTLLYDWNVIIPEVETVNAIDSCQTGACTNEGDPFFVEDFGSGTTRMPLAGGKTNYSYNGASSSSDPSVFLKDGEYLLASSSDDIVGGWYIVEDHTPGDVDGRMLIVNASHSPGEFYRTRVGNLCQSSYYSFTAYIMNLLDAGGFCPTVNVGLPINTIFQIEDLNGNIIGRTTTGDIKESVSPEWNEYSFGFYIPTGVSEVELVLINNYPGGCGNDLAIDDISFLPCGPNISITSGVSGAVCYGDTVLMTGSIGPEIQYPEFQWQVSTDNGTTWGDMMNETNDTLFVFSTLANDNFMYRMGGSIPGNISSSACRIYSNPESITTMNCCADPEVSISGIVNICPGEIVSLEIGITDGPIDFVISDGISDSSFTGITSGFNYDVSPTRNVTYTITDANVSSGPLCVVDKTGEAKVSIFDSLFVSIAKDSCNDILTHYTVMFEISEGDTMTYQEINGLGSIVGSIFTSDLIASGTDYSFTISDQNGCRELDIKGTHTCNCVTNSGTLDLTNLNICASSIATTLYNDDFVLDANDTIEYILHTSNTKALGAIIARNSSPSFSYNTTKMNFNTTYYISVIAGDNDGNNQVDLTDGCLDVSIGTPLRFFSEPTASIEGTTEICEGDSANIKIILRDLGTYNVIYTLNGGLKDTLQDVQNGTLFTSPVNTTVYTLLGVTRDSLPFCPINLNDKETITVNPYPVITTSPSDIAICSGNFHQFSTKAAPYETLTWLYASQKQGVYTNQGNEVEQLATDPGHYYVSLNNKGCIVNSDTVELQTLGVDVKAFANKYRIEEGESIQIYATEDSSYSYIWRDETTGELFSDWGIHTRSPLQTTTYSVFASSLSNPECNSPDEITVEVFSKILIPNGFSPNGDSQNERWFVKGLELFPNTEMYIYNRWGTLVYKNAGTYDEPWDGKSSNGTELPVATYYYVIKLNDTENQDFVGNVTIMK